MKGYDPDRNRAIVKNAVAVRISLNAAHRCFIERATPRSQGDYPD
ncbi:MAG: hypothetical protein ABSB34_06525 [Candidatus Limnocylindrales bacterium]